MPTPNDRRETRDPGRRLESWKEIAAYVKRDSRTVRRWEESEGLPVRRHQHTGGSTVYAYESEIDAWLATREAQGLAVAPAEAAPPPGGHRRERSRVMLAGMAAAAVVVLCTLLAWYFFRGSGQKHVLAVLPFENMSGDPGQEYWVDGFTEEMISRLAQTEPERLMVIARTSSMSYKGKRKRVDEVGRELGVDYVIEGSARRQGDRVRITAQLIRVKDQTHVLSRDYDRDARETLQVQSEVCREISAQVLGALSSQTAAVPVGAVDSEAHALCLRAWYLWQQPGQDNIQKAIEISRQAVEKDPSYADAHSTLAWSKAQMSFYGYSSPREVYSQAVPDAERSLALDPRNGKALAVLAAARYHDRKWLEAVSLIGKAVDASPSNADLRGFYADVLLGVGERDEALRQARIVQRLDPLSVWAQAYSAQTLAYLRRYGEAAAICRKILEYAPDNLYARWVLGVVLTNSGAYEEAISEFLKRKVPTASTNWALGYAYGVSGRKEEARKILDFHLELQRKRYIWPAIVAIQYIGLGEKAKALDVLEKAEADHEDHYLQRAKLDPYFDRIRNEPRFQRIIERMNFPK